MLIENARRLIPRLLVALIAVLALVVAPGAQAASKPTIVLVHGAFADASGWSGEIARLERRGYPVVAPANPLRGVAADTAYLRAFLATIKGPIVLVGHSYGGFVITNAATGNPNVKALVYVAGYAPDAGDSVQSLGTLGNDGRDRPRDARPAAVPGARGLAAARGLHQARRVPRHLRRGPAAQAGPRDGALPAAGGAGGALRALGSAGVEDDPVVVPRADARPRDRDRRPARHGQAHPPAQDRAGEGRVARRDDLPPEAHDPR